MLQFALTIIKRYTIDQMFGVIFNIFERRLLCSPRLHLFDQKYIKNRNIVKYYNAKDLYNLRIWCSIIQLLLVLSY